MPLSGMDKVPFSEMRGRNSHQGPRNAGNKSLLTFRSDVGIPGYTGYTPGWCTVPIPITGSTVHTGRLPDDAHLQEATLQSDQRHAVSEYRNTYQADSATYHAPDKTGGGYWFEDRQRKAADNSPPFLATTTYKSEVLEAPATTAKQLQQAEGCSQTLVNYKVARDRRVKSANPCLGSSQTLSSTTAAISSGQLIGYRTTYGVTTAQATTLAAERVAQATAARPLSYSAVERPRLAVMPSAGKPRFEATSTYSKDFGVQGSDPMMRATTNPAEMMLTATTRDLNEGTTRAAYHPPGYTGFIPAAHTNVIAVQQASGQTVKQNIKTDMLPATLDQYSRSRLAHYTGYKPHFTAGGASTVQPAHGPTKETAQGFINLQVLKHGAQPHDSKHCINSRKGLMTFFTGGGESISDNGEADAQKFFARLRPLEGRMKTSTASVTNHVGANFAR